MDFLHLYTKPYVRDFFQDRAQINDDNLLRFLAKKALNNTMHLFAIETNFIEIYVFSYIHTMKTNNYPNKIITCINVFLPLYKIVDEFFSECDGKQT